MTNLEEFISKIDEAKEKVVNAKDLDPTKVAVADGKNIVSGADVDGKKIAANKRPTGKTVYAYDEAKPEDFKKLTPEEEDELAENNYKIYDRIMDGLDFMIIGQAGWAKTALIKSISKQCGRSVVTVYLDKAVASDLGGIPVPAEHESGQFQQAIAIPTWVFPMLENPDKKFTLFFDEMNQAQPDVMNALMPIILEHTICGIKFDNFIVGAAGNEMDENLNGLTDINDNKALKARLAPMKWHSHDDQTWSDSFKYLHKTYDDVIGKEIIDKTFELRNYLSSPRDIERWIFTKIKSKLAEGRRPRPEQVKEDIMDHCIWDKLDDSTVNSREFERQIDEYVDFMVKYVSNGGKKDDNDTASDRRRTKGADQIDKNDKSALIKGLEQGYVFNSKANDPENGDDHKYLCSVEGAITYPDGDEGYFDPGYTGITAEYLHRIIKEMEAAGKKPKYQTDKDGWDDALKNGWWTVRRIGKTEDYEAVPCKDTQPK